MNWSGSLISRLTKNKNEILHYNSNSCVGCGLCVGICEYRAIKLEKRVY
ncbi:MAG: 4Fe-4S binding protein [Candidatus Heimdallarchaeota archaeon]|nr:MAG: 4Fe-4S binding protein [Candidatus Heimdallarchaeota archaeon]